MLARAIAKESTRTSTARPQDFERALWRRQREPSKSFGSLVKVLVLGLRERDAHERDARLFGDRARQHGFLPSRAGRRIRCAAIAELRRRRVGRRFLGARSASEHRTATGPRLLPPNFSSDGASPCRTPSSRTPERWRDASPHNLDSRFFDALDGVLRRKRHECGRHGQDKGSSPLDAEMRMTPVGQRFTGHGMDRGSCMIRSGCDACRIRDRLSRFVRGTGDGDEDSTWSSRGIFLANETTRTKKQRCCTRQPVLPKMSSSTTPTAKIWHTFQRGVYPTVWVLLTVFGFPAPRITGHLAEFAGIPCRRWHGTCFAARSSRRVQRGVDVWTASPHFDRCPSIRRPASSERTS